MRHPDPPAPRRLRAFAYGLRAEGWCALWLRAKGYRILARRYRCPAGEIDIVAARGRMLVAVEVKARTGGGGPEALAPAQRRRVERAALSFVAQQRARERPGTLRFDLMLVGGWRWPRHLRNAWQAELDSRGQGIW